jgi:hypothetical protein
MSGVRDMADAPEGDEYEVRSFVLSRSSAGALPIGVRPRHKPVPVSLLLVAFVPAIGSRILCVSWVAMLPREESCRDLQPTRSSCNTQSAATNTSGAPTLRPTP